MWDVVRFFALAALPAVNFFVRFDHLTDYWVGQARLAELIPFVRANLGLAGLLKCLLGAAAIYLFGRRHPKPPGTSRTCDFAIPGLAFLLGILAPLPLAFTPKYPALVRDWAPYFTGYLSFLCFTVAAWGALRVVARSRAGSWTWGGIAAALCVIAALNSIAGEGVMRQQARHGLRWRLMRAFLQTRYLHAIPDGAVIVAPALWEGIEQYWSRYVAAHAGRHIEFPRNIPDRLARLSATGRLYWADTLPNREDGLLAISRVEREQTDGTDGISERLLSDRTLLIGTRDYAHESLSVTTGGGPRQIVLPRFQFDSGAWEAEIDEPHMVAGTMRFRTLPGP